MRKQIVSVMAVLLGSSLGAALIVSMAQPHEAEAVDASFIQKVEAHQAMLDAMGGYFAKLQEKGILPAPDKIDQFAKEKANK